MNTKQQEILERLKSGHSLFITGASNTGKTAVLKEFCGISDSVIVCSYSPLCTFEILNTIVINLFDELIANYKTVDIPFELKVARTIVIDDVQNIDTDTFTAIISIIQRAEKEAFKDSRYSRNAEIPLCAKKQLVIAGDFFQSHNTSEKYIFETETWKNLNLDVCILTHNVCKLTKKFAQSIDAVRIGDIKGIKWIQDNCSYYRMKKSIYIYNRRKDSESRNEQKLKDIRSSETRFLAQGQPGYSSDICSDILILKPGSVVVALTTIKFKYRRGDIGKVKEVTDDNVIVQWENGKETRVERFLWPICEYRYVKGKGENHRKLILKQISYIRQFPLKLAYAISIDEAKNMLFERAIITPEADDQSMLYNSLTKIKQVDGLFLKTRNLTLEAPSTILAYYDSIGFNVHIDHRGGARTGSGRKPKFGATTSTIRAPDYMIPIIDGLAALPPEEALKIAKTWQEDLQKFKHDKE